MDRPTVIEGDLRKTADGNLMILTANGDVSFPCQTNVQMLGISSMHGVYTVSYTHLDVYKRQLYVILLQNKLVLSQVNYG